MASYLQTYALTDVAIFRTTMRLCGQIGYVGHRKVQKCKMMKETLTFTVQSTNRIIRVELEISKENRKIG